MIGTLVTVMVLLSRIFPGPASTMPPAGRLSTAACTRAESSLVPVPSTPNQARSTWAACGLFQRPVAVPPTAKTVPPLSSSVPAASQYRVPPPTPGRSAR
jgi:hypothetical protein